MKSYISLLALCLLAPQIARAEPIEIAVSDEKGVGVAGALVQVESFQLDDENNRTPIVNSATSDAAGIARFDLQPTSAGGTYFGRAAAFKAGLALGGVELNNGKRAISLLAPTPATGTVRDEKGAPIVGALVQLQTLRPAPDRSWLIFYGESARAFESAIETRTDAQGAWKLSALPANSEYSIDIKAPGYAQTAARIKAGEGPPTTTIKPEARATGQLLKPDGTPLAGIEISPQSAGGVYIAPLVTDAQGRFAATGLSADKWGFSVDLKDQPFVVGDEDGVLLDLKIGDNLLPPIRLQNGVVVRGNVRDTDGAPVDMRVTTSLPNQFSAQTRRTDAQGNFEMRVPAGERSFRLQPLDSSFRNANEPKLLQIAPDDKPQIEWILERAPVVRGIITDEAGAPVRGSFSFVKGGNRNGGMGSASFATDKDGRFETPVDIESAARVVGWVGKDGKQYEIVGNNRLMLPMKAELKLVARLSKPVFFHARAVDTTGRPLAGVEFEAMSYTDFSGSTLRLRSDENGEIKSENIGIGARLQRPLATKKGYELSEPIEILKVGDDWSADQIIFARRDAELSGIVLNGGGQPAAGARVLVGGIETLTDAQGAWALKNLPPGNLLVAALSADGQSFASARAPLSRPLQLQNVTLVKGDLVLAQNIIAQLKADADFAQKQRLNLPENESFIAQVKAANQTPNSSPVRLFYQLLNQTNAAQTGELESATTQMVLDGWQAMSERADRVTAAAALMEARPDWKDAAGAGDFVFQLEEDVSGELAGQDPAGRQYRVEGTFALAAALETLGQSESADRAFKNALDWTFAMPNADNNGESGRDALLTRGVGAFGGAPRLFDKLLNYYDPESYWHHRAIAEVIAPTSRARGLGAALPYIELLQSLPDSKPAPVQGEEMPYSPLGRMPQVIAGAIYADEKSEPALALKLASDVRIVSRYGEQNLPNRALIAAAFFQSPAVAAEIWRAQVPKLDLIEAAKTAARIAATDESLARELYVGARERLEKTGDATFLRFTANSAQPAEFAFIEAQFEPARARFRLEKAWPTALKEENSRYQLRRYVLAMARVNPQRADEMAREIPDDKERSRFEARYALARALAGENED